MLAVFMQWPWLALIPAAVFAVLYGKSRGRLALAMTIAWLLYGAYELGMKRRILCSGECNIRVDLLLIYPVLLIVSLVATISSARTMRRTGGPAARG